MEKVCSVASNRGSVWRLLQDNPDRYIYDAKKGVHLDIPPKLPKE